MSLAVYSGGRVLGRIHMEGSRLRGTTRGIQGMADHVLRREGSAQAAYRALSGKNNGYISVIEEPDEPVEFGWRYNPGELRNEHGEWTKAGELLGEAGKDYGQPDHARLISDRGRPPDPADHPFFKAHPVSPEHIVASYDRAPDPIKQQGMRWYSDAHVIAKALAGGNADKGAGVLAAYSPQTGWPSNMMNAARSLEMGRALGPGEGMITTAMQANAQKAIDGAPADVANSSPKTRAFARLIRNGGDMPGDDQGDVVIDRHAMTVAIGQRLPKKEADLAPIGKERHYAYVADQYRLAAKMISQRDGVTVAPHQLQAITWLQQQDENEAADLSGNVNKGQATQMRNSWAAWGKLAAAEEIPTYPGTTMLDATPHLISQQVIELDWQMEPRDSHGRWTKFGGVGEAVKVMEKEREGFSVSPYSGSAPSGGYMVALDGHTHRYPAAILDDPEKLHKAIDDMLMAERESFQGRDMYLGGWVEDGKLWLDPSQNVPDRATAEQLGRARDQVGIFDLNTFSTINTGGSGGGRIIDHANQGARGGAPGLLGPAGGRAPGGGGGDRGSSAGGIAAQVIALGWHDAWRHELRGRHGEWVRDGAGLMGPNGKLRDALQARIDTTSDPDVRYSLVEAKDAAARGDLDAARFKIGLAIGYASVSDTETDTASLHSLFNAADRAERAARTKPQVFEDAHPLTPGEQLVKDMTSKSAQSLPALFGPGGHLDWDGKAPTIFAPGTRPSLRGTLLAVMDWNGHMEMLRTVVSGLREDQVHPDRPIEAPDNYTVPLHEMIHAVVPEGQHRESNGDEQAYQGSYAAAEIEEGFTELGTIQHAADFFRQQGVGDRKTLMMAQADRDSPEFTAAKEDAQAALASLRDKLLEVRPSEARANALDALISGVGRLDDTDDPYVLDDVILQARTLLRDNSLWATMNERAVVKGVKAAVDRLQEKQFKMMDIPVSDHLTMSEYAAVVNTPARIRSGNAWDHYAAETRQAFEWTSLVAQMRTGKGEDDPATLAEIQRISDEVNAQGTSEKIMVMARHVAADMTTDQAELAKILPSVRNSILNDWGGDPQSVFQHARLKASQRAAEVAGERAAA
jgi:hypothetical protein